tara:strand:+ start:3029 stop:3247 length:219 start_codon:yes stop_codon:yes gene_type:complete
MSKIIEVLSMEGKFVIFLFYIFRIGIIKFNQTQAKKGIKILIGIWRFDIEFCISRLYSIEIPAITSRFHGNA